MYTSNIRGIEKTLKENQALITISANKRNVFKLKCCTENDVNVYTGYSLKNVLIKASKFLPENKPENQVCVMGNFDTIGSIEYTLKHFDFKITGFNKDLSKVTVGGIDLKYVNSKTMESKITPNLYFAGEVLDADGPTGGYNLKIAFSTGYLAGLSASEK